MIKNKPNALQLDRLTNELYKEFYEEHEPLFKYDRQRYWHECTRHVEKEKRKRIYGTEETNK